MVVATGILIIQVEVVLIYNGIIILKMAMKFTIL